MNCPFKLIFSIRGVICSHIRPSYCQNRSVYHLSWYRSCLRMYLWAVSLSLLSPHGAADYNYFLLCLLRLQTLLGIQTEAPSATRSPPEEVDLSCTSTSTLHTHTCTGPNVFFFFFFYLSALVGLIRRHPFNCFVMGYSCTAHRRAGGKDEESVCTGHIRSPRQCIYLKVLSSTKQDWSHYISLSIH